MLDIKQYGKVFQITSDVMTKYYSKALASAFYVDDMKKDLKNLCNEQYKADHGFPVEFYAWINTVMIHWFENGYMGYSTKEEINDQLHKIWAYTKKYLPVERTDDVWDALMEEGNALAKDKIAPVATLYLRVIEWMQKLDREKENVTTA